jgi:DNA polymerase III epsilon subunit-like protein
MSQLYMAFDCETGGFNSEKADLLTAYFGIIDEDYKILDELYLKLKPENRLPIAEAGALKVNGINIADHLADPDTVTYSEGKKRLVALLRKHLKKNGRFSNIMPFGYNVPFDEKWVQQYLLEEDEWRDILHYKSVDVMKTVDDLKRFGWFPKELGSLETVVSFLGLPKRGAHNAKEDTLMTIDVDTKLREIMRSKKDASAGGVQQDLISLLEAE